LREQLVGEEEAAAVAVVADDALDAGHLADEGGLEGVGQEDGGIEAAGPEAGGQVEELALAGLGLGLAGAVGDEAVGPGHAGVHWFDVAAEEVGDVGGGVEVADGAKGGGGHDRVADPGWLDDEDSLGGVRSVGHSEQSISSSGEGVKLEDGAGALAPTCRIGRKSCKWCGGWGLCRNRWVRSVI
jgi:hypothetical protein